MTHRETALTLAQQAYEGCGSARDIGEAMAHQTLATVALVHAVLSLDQHTPDKPGRGVDRVRNDERFREALRRIADYGDYEGDLIGGHEDAMRNIARNTLAASDGALGAGEITAEALAEAMWDAREISDPSGELTGCTSDDHSRAPVFWKQAVAENLWPGSREDAVREARMVLELLEAPIAPSSENQRSGS